jgi:PST family polysaccharide transporter
MRVLSVAGLVISVNALNSDLLLSLGKASWRMKITSVTTVLNLSAFVIGVQFGIVGVAAGAAVVAIGMAPVSYWAVSRLMPLHPFEYAKRIWAPAVASAVFAATLALVRHVLGDTPDWLVLAACGAAGTIVYAAMIRLLAPPVAGEAIQLSGALLPGRRRRRARAAAVDDQPAGVGTVPQTETSPTRA